MRPGGFSAATNIGFLANPLMHKNANEFDQLKNQQ